MSLSWVLKSRKGSEELRSEKAPNNSLRAFSKVRNFSNNGGKDRF